MTHILYPKPANYVWEPRDILHAARAEDIDFLVEAANRYPRLQIASRRMLDTVNGLTGIVSRREELDGAVTQLREALDAPD